MIKHFFLRTGEGDAQATSVVPQRRLRLLFWQQVGPGEHHEAVFHQGKVAQFDVAFVDRTITLFPIHPHTSLELEVESAFRSYLY